jgi:hypothetical protein
MDGRTDGRMRARKRARLPLPACSGSQGLDCAPVLDRKVHKARSLESAQACKRLALYTDANRPGDLRSLCKY